MVGYWLKLWGYHLPKQDVSLIMWSRCHETKWELYISTFTRLINSKPGTVVTYVERLAPIKSHVLLTIWSRNVKRQVKNVISPLLQDLQASNFAQCYSGLGALTCKIIWPLITWLHDVTWQTLSSIRSITYEVDIVVANQAWPWVARDSMRTRPHMPYFV